KEDIKIKATDKKLIVEAHVQDRKYYKKIILPSKVKPETAKATFRNGVLEVCFEKKTRKLWKKLRR
ncbi:MAG: Hsp20/alpha crystallin family protein, partial [Candidatus Methanomethylicota archaeon]